MTIYRKEILHVFNAFVTHFRNAALDCGAARNLEGRGSIDIAEEFMKLGILYLIKWLV